MHTILASLKRRYRKQKPPKLFSYIYQTFGLVPTGVFQVGANGGGEIREFVAQGIQQGIFVEPLPDAYRKLGQAVLIQPDFHAVNAVCSNAVGEEVSFYISTSGSAGASSSILKPSGVLSVHPEVPFESQPVTLVSTTVDQIAADFRAKGLEKTISGLDLLFMDTQGSELIVLKGACEFLKQVRFIFTEVSLGGLYENDASHMDLSAYLASRGFSLAFMYMNRQGWGDALYVHNSLFVNR